MLTVHFRSFTQFYLGKSQRDMLHIVGFTSYKSLSFSLKRANVKMKVGIILAKN